MRDLQRALEKRAGRAAPKGAEQLRQRVAYTLAAGSAPGLVPEGGRRVPGLVVAGLAAVVVLVIGGATALLLRAGEGPEIAEPLATTLPVSLPPTTPPTASTDAPPTTVSTTAVPSTTVASTTVPGALEIGPEWSLLMTDPNAPAAVDVLQTRNGFVVVGGGSIWASVGGAEWEPVLERADSRIFSVTEGEDGYLAVGMCGLEWCDLATTWISPDGRTWAETGEPLEDTWFTYFNDVVAVGSGYLAGGQDPENASAAIWSSPDGVTWTRVWRHPGANSAIYALESTGEGYLAVGRTSHVRGPGEEEDAAVWASTNGTDWTLVSTDRDVFGTPDAGDIENWEYWSARAALSGEIGTVVAGDAADSLRTSLLTAAVWFSADDGATWVRVDRNTGPFEGASIRGLAETPTGLIAVGEQGGRAAMWTSGDGLVWEAVGLEVTVFGSGVLFDIVVTGDTVVVVGSRGFTAAIWGIAADSIGP